jgi:hypothetical protein
VTPEAPPEVTVAIASAMEARASRLAAAAAAAAAEGGGDATLAAAALGASSYTVSTYFHVVAPYSQAQMATAYPNNVYGGDGELFWLLFF